MYEEFLSKVSILGKYEDIVPKWNKLPYYN